MKSTPHYWAPENLICGPHFSRMWKVARFLSCCEQGTCSCRQRDQPVPKFLLVLWAYFSHPVLLLKIKWGTHHISQTTRPVSFNKLLICLGFPCPRKIKSPETCCIDFLFCSFFLPFSAILEENEVSEFCLSLQTHAHTNFLPGSQEQLFSAEKDGFVPFTWGPHKIELWAHVYLLCPVWARVEWFWVHIVDRANHGGPKPWGNMSLHSRAVQGDLPNQ